MKYKILKDQYREYDSGKVYRIMATKDFVTGTGTVIKSGDIGGYIANYKNLSQDGNCWVSDNAEVCDNAVVCDNAEVFGNAVVRDNAVVCDNAEVCDNAVVGGTGEIGGAVKII